MYGNRQQWPTSTFVESLASAAAVAWWYAVGRTGLVTMSPLGKGNYSNLCKVEFWQYSNAFLLLTVPKLLFARIINWYNPLKITLFLYKSTPSPNLNITIRDGSHFSCIKDCYHRSTMLMWKSTPFLFQSVTNYRLFFNSNRECDKRETLW